MPDKANEERSEKRKQTIEEVRREQAHREKGYRERALKLFPWVRSRIFREKSSPAHGTSQRSQP